MQFIQDLSNTNNDADAEENSGLGQDSEVRIYNYSDNNNSSQRTLIKINTWARLLKRNRVYEKKASVGLPTAFPMC